MKSQSPNAPVRASVHARRLAVLLAGLGTSLTAAEIQKANNTDDMTQTTSWTGGVLPGVNDVAVFDATVGGPNFLPLASSVSWQGIKILNNANGLTFDTFGSGGPSVIVTLGSAGIDMSGGTSGSTFTFDSPALAVPAGTTQTWSVADGATLNILGPLSRGTGATLNYNLGTTGTGSLLVPDASFGASSAISAYATVNQSDFMAVSASRAISTGSAVLANYTVNPDVGAANPNIGASTMSVLDIVNSNTLAGATAARITGNWTLAGIRFNTAHATGLDWTVDGTSTTRNISMGNGGILVSPAVGAHNVVFNGSSQFRFGSTTADLFLHQYNTAGDLIFNNPMNGTSNAHRIVKDGPGRVILANANSFTGATYINAGTLQVGNANAAGTLGGAVINNGVLAFNRSDAFPFAQMISGTGAVTNLGAAGTLTLSGANTFTGPVNLNAGSVAFSALNNLGAGTTLNFSGGTLQWASGNTLDVSTARTLNFSSSVAGLDTNGNNVALAGVIGNGGAGGLKKVGAGTLTLSGANNFSGASTVNAGVLNVTNTTGSATGSGALTVASGGTLAGTGTLSGAVTVASSGKLTPGASGVGTLNVGGLSLASGSLLDLEFANTSSYDKVVVTGSGGLSISGGAVNIYTAGGTTSYATPGTYNLIQYSGAVGGTGSSALSVLNPQAGYSYTFGASGSFVTLTITQLGMITQWNAAGSGSFGDSSKWNNGTPTGSGATANFTTAQATNATVTLDGTRTLGGMSFDSSPGGYTIAQGTGGSLVLSNGSSDVAVNVLSGSHAITAPVSLSGNLAVSTSTDASLAISGVVTGTGNVVKSGPGSLTLSATNSITGATTIAGGTLEFGSLASIGNGAISINGGTLRYGAGNTADISGRTVTIGVNGATIDTNGNNITYASAIGNSGEGSFTKVGAGVLILSVPNTYAGSTNINGGSISIADNTFLNATTAGVNLNGGTLATTATIATTRPFTVGASNGGLNVADATTLTISSALAGTGKLTKSGAGLLVLDTASSFTGGVQIDAGSLTVSNSSAAGTGVLAMANGTTLTVGNAATFIVSPLTVSGTNANVNISTASATGAYSGLVTGTSDQSLTMSGATAVNFSSSAKQLQGFAGTVNIPSGTYLAFRATALNNGGDNTTFNVDGGLSTRNNGAVALGALTGSGSVSSGASGNASTTLVYTIGAKNINATFSGVISDADIANLKLVAVNKTGTGVQIFSGANTYTGATNVNAGTLRIDGSLGATTVTVNAGGTLAGSGSIGGAVTVNNGTLRTGAPTAGDGQLTITGALALSGAATPVASVTQFDFAGAAYNKVKADGGVSYAGTLALNFTSAIYNRDYTLFQVTGSTSGAFTAVTATSTVTTSPVSLVDSGSGTWTGTLDGTTLTYNAATGVLSVTGSSFTAGSIGTSVLSATAGNAQVNLSWTAATGADTYVLKRSTTPSGPYTVVSSSIGGLSYSDTGLTNGTTYYYVVQGKNSATGLVGAVSNEASATPVAAPAHTALETWRFDQFGVYTDDGTVLAGDTEDYDGDGLANLLEYALGTNPKVANASPVAIGRSGNNLTLTYPKGSPVDANLTYTVKASSDLTTGFVTGTGATSGTGPFVYTDTVDVSAAGVRRFLRLEVSYTAPTP